MSRRSTAIKTEDILSATDEVELYWRDYEVESGLPDDLPTVTFHRIHGEWLARRGNESCRAENPVLAYQGLQHLGARAAGVTFSLPTVVGTPNPTG